MNTIVSLASRKSQHALEIDEGENLWLGPKQRQILQFSINLYQISVLSYSYSTFMSDATLTVHHPSVDSPNRKLHWSVSGCFLFCLHPETHFHGGIWGSRCHSLRKPKRSWWASTLLLSNRTGISPKYAPVKFSAMSQTYTGKHMSQVCASLCHSALFRWESRLSSTLGKAEGVCWQHLHKSIFKYSDHVWCEPGQRGRRWRGRVGGSELFYCSRTETLP